MDKDSKTLDLKLPTVWEELSQKQLRYLFSLIAQGYSIDEVKAFCLFRWNKITILHRYSDKGYMCKKRKQRFVVTAAQVTAAVAALDWIKTLPATPVRIARIGSRQAVAADFQGVPFETFIICDNLYQGYISTQNEQLLDEMATHLYRSKCFSLIIRLSQADRIGIFYWFASLKAMFSRQFHNFLQPVPQDNANLLDSDKSQYEILTAAVNAQIRALTKGDVTKEKQVLALDTWRALTELDALAKEYEELNKRVPR